MTIEELIKLAEAGDPEAQYELVSKYREGIDVNRDDKIAFEWCLKAAEQGITDAQFNVGIYYDKGIGTDKNAPKAFEWYLKAAQQGYISAQFNVGVCYDDGYGVEQDNVKAFEWYLKAAEGGHIKAQHRLGLCYFSGIGVEKDTKRAVEWFLKAAERGHVAAQFNLGLCLEYGAGTEKDERKAFEWYLKAAEQGDAGAQHCVGWYYSKGIGVEKDEKKAFEWYLKAAEQGHVSAQFNLGIRYKQGLGVKKNEKKAFEWYLKAAEQGHVKAQYNLSSMFGGGIGVKKDEGKAFEWCLKAAEQGYANAQYNVGVYYYFGTGVKADEHKAIEFFMKAAEQGVEEALYNLGVCYINGIGVEKDEQRVIEFFLKTAEHGSKEAQFIAGVCFMQGSGVEKDDETAFELFLKSAEQGFAEAQGCLGLCFEYGVGVEKDEREAYAWYLKSAEQGNAAAECSLGLCFEYGIGVEKDEKRAFFWYSKSAEHGNAYARYSLGCCYEQGIGVEKDEDKAFELFLKAAEQGDEDAKNEVNKYHHKHQSDFERRFDFANVGKRYDLFISWNHNDKKFKDNLVGKIEDFNFDDTNKNDEHIYPHYRAWDSDRDADGLIEESIRNAINNSKFFLVILSEYSLQSDWVRLEVETALNRIDEGTWSPKNLLVVYLNSDNFDVAAAVNALPKDNVFRKLGVFAANYAVSEADDTVVRNVCERIKRGLEEEVIRNYRHKMTVEQDKFKYSLRNQYSDSVFEGNGQIADALLSFEEGYIKRDAHRVSDGAAVPLDKLAQGGDFYLFGDGGTGKSLYISNLMREYFTADKFFLRINAIDYDEYIGKCDSLSELMARELNKYLVDSDEYRSTRIVSRARGDAGNPITVVIDGLDEINDEKKKKLIRLIGEYKKSNAADRFIFTSRTVECVDDLRIIFKDLELYKLLGFDVAEQNKLYDCIKAKLFKSNDGDDKTVPKPFDGDGGGIMSVFRVRGDENLKAEFFARLDTIGDDIKKNPLLLSNLIFIYLKNRGRDFPTRKYEIVGRSVGIFVDDLENNRGALARFAYRKYLTGGKLENILGSIAFRKLQGCSHDFRRLLIEYFSEPGRCESGDDPETVGNEIFNYLSRRAIISSEKITHDIFTAFFACCYLYNSIYELYKKYDVHGIRFRKGAPDDPEYDGREYLSRRLSSGGEFGREDGMWPEVSAELIMKLDYEIHALPPSPMSPQNLSYAAFDGTLGSALTGRGFSNSAIEIVREFSEKEGGFYFAEFIRSYLPA